MYKRQADYYERAVAAGAPLGVSAKDAANWISGELFRLLKESGEAFETVAGRFRPEHVAEVQDLLNKGTITRTSAKEVFEASFREGRAPSQVVAERGLAVIGAGDALAGLAREAIAANPKAVAEYRGGKTAAIKFLMGQVMKATRGQASPQAVQAALEEELAK